MTPCLLLIDTSGREARVELVRQGKKVAGQRWQSDRQLGRELLQRLDTMMQEAGWSWRDVTRVAVHQGPGHYSSLRAGLVTATMLAYGMNIPLVPIRSHGLAAQVEEAWHAVPVDIVTPVYK